MDLNKLLELGFDKFRGAIFTAQFYQSLNDSSLFIWRTSYGCTILLFYVDDMIISGNDTIRIKELKGHLMCCFKWKILYNWLIFLSFESPAQMLFFEFINRSMRNIYLTTKLTNSKTNDIHMELNTEIWKDHNHPLLDPIMYVV